MSLTDTVLRPIAALVLAAVVANCNEACIPYGRSISPAEAYAMEVSGCVATRNTKVQVCAQEASTMAGFEECKADADDDMRGCRGMVDRKYMNYNSNGNYPSEPISPPVR